MLQGNHEDAQKVIDRNEEEDRYFPGHVIYDRHYWLKEWLDRDYYDTNL